ncbi:GGDEF domain-containing protein [Hippea maritima]|uniref:diguanylate cyclase n=1 Tax=Hippea maritima (strain ATCC 700847 / DSM 10411 / MH2) TaxID=760142 RepID=F2LV85_HIPMA|nr:GGDEF domain-containing protein [Hippea maritima]AEA33669.1 diguanylate cyclase [Hippea maritima DSM 10411]
MLRKPKSGKTHCSVYIENLSTAIIHLLIALKANDEAIDSQIDKFKEQVKKIKFEENPSKVIALRDSIADFVIKYDEYIHQKRDEFNKLLLSNISILITLAKSSEADTRWKNSLDEVKELLKNKIDIEQLKKTKDILFKLGTATKDSKDIVYRDIVNILFELLDLETDSPDAKPYLEKVQKLQTKLSSSPYRLDEKEIRDEIKSIVEEKERLEEEYIESLQKKLDKALKALIYTITTFTTSSNNYVNTFEGHIEEINNTIKNGNVDVDELSKRLIGIAIKIKDTTLNMKNELEEYSKKIDEAKKTIEELKEKLKKAEENLIIDPLTGVYNRRGLLHFLKIEIARAKRYKQPMSIIMADLDHFSRVNNTYGHLAGDIVLKGFCKTVKSLIRATDIAARYGGEEFIIILPNTDIDSAYEVAEKIRNAISKLKFKYKDETFSITSSFGVSQYKDDETIEKLIKRADAALYKAKEKRNITVKESQI